MINDDELDDSCEFGVGATSFNDIDGVTDLLFWLDDNKSFFPLDDLKKRGYVFDDSESVDAFNILSSSLSRSGSSLFRAGNTKKNTKKTVLVNTWMSLVSYNSQYRGVKEFCRDDFTLDWLQDFVKLSCVEGNINLLVERLEALGVILVLEPAFEGLGIDGAVFLNDSGNPVIGHSIRFDRYDNFWFTLLHELSHVFLHYDDLETPVIEDFKSADSDNANINEIEREADYFAKNLIVPNSIWRRSDVVRKQTAKSVNELASELGIHPALVAGKFRHDKNNYGKFSEIVNSVSVRRILGI